MRPEGVFTIAWFLHAPRADCGGENPGKLAWHLFVRVREIRVKNTFRALIKYYNVAITGETSQKTLYTLICICISSSSTEKAMHNKNVNFWLESVKKCWIHQILLFLWLKPRAVELESYFLLTLINNIIVSTTKSLTYIAVNSLIQTIFFIKIIIFITNIIFQWTKNPYYFYNEFFYSLVWKVNLQSKNQF